jgi:hypothetical protein
MAKSKITVTVDEELIEIIKRESTESLSAVVNRALSDYAEGLARRAALKELLDEWEEQLGPIPADAMAYARAAFDELDGVITAEEAAKVPYPGTGPESPSGQVA